MSKASLKKAMTLGSHWAVQHNGIATQFSGGATKETNLPRSVAHVQTNAVAFSTGDRTHPGFAYTRENPNARGRWQYFDAPRQVVTREGPTVWVLWRWRDDGTGVEPEFFEVRRIKGRDCERMATFTLIDPCQQEVEA